MPISRGDWGWTGSGGRWTRWASPDGFDWIELTNGEWLKGEIISMYDRELEFDSDELGDLTFDFDDIKEIRGPVDVGLIEGGCANEENVRVLREFRRHCKVLVSVGDCAINGGVPAMRNSVPLKECYEEAFLNGPTVVNPSPVIDAS